MTRLIRILSFVALLLGPGQSAAADRTRVELTDPAQPASLRVEIEWGSILVSGAPDAAAINIETRGDGPDELTGALITASEEDNRVAVVQAPLASGSFRSVNLEIRTPSKTDLQLVMNRGGDIRVEAIEGLVEVSNLNGSVDLAGIAGAAAVNASNGSITGGFRELRPDRDLIFTSLNGSISLCLPAGFSSRLHLTTAGAPIRSDFPIERHDSERTVGPGETATLSESEVQGRIGSGGALLRVSTLNGEIYLQRCD